MLFIVLEKLQFTFLKIIKNKTPLPTSSNIKEELRPEVPQEEDKSFDPRLLKTIEVEEKTPLPTSSNIKEEEV